MSGIRSRLECIPCLFEQAIRAARVAGLDAEATRRLLDEVDVVVAKVQGNYETLTGVSRELFFMLAVKCGVISEALRLPKGASVLLHHPGG